MGVSVSVCVCVCVNLRQLQSATSLTLVLYFHSNKKISTKLFSFFGFCAIYICINCVFNYAS